MADAPAWMKLLMGEEIFRHPVPSEVTQIPAWRELLDFSGANTPLPAGVSCETIWRLVRRQRRQRAAHGHAHRRPGLPGGQS